VGFVDSSRSGVLIDNHHAPAAAHCFICDFETGAGSTF